MADLGTYDAVAVAGDAAFAVENIAGGATSYEVYDVAGTLVASGAVSSPVVNIPAPDAHGWPPGWYLILFTSAAWGSFGYATDSLQVNVLRQGVANMPPVPARGTTPAADDANNRGLDLYLHGFTLLGPNRWQIHDAANPTVYTAGNDQGGTIAKIAANLALEHGAAGYSKAAYADSQRPRPQLVQFPQQLYTAAGYAAGVSAAVAALGPGTASDVHYFEGLNEPEGQFGRTPAQSAAQYDAFRAAVKAGNPAALAVGPGEVSYSPVGASLGISLAHFDTFLSAIVPGSLDGFSVHNYNSANGDHVALDAWIQGAKALLAAHGYPADLPCFYTEVGWAGMSDWGTFEPNRGLQWTALMLVTGERWGIPKEHQWWFYDAHLGGDPTSGWLKESTGDLRPYATLFRVYSEEVFGKAFIAPLDFGAVGNTFFRANVLDGPGGACVVAMTQGLLGDTIELSVDVPGPLRCTDWQGRETMLPVRRQRVVMPVGQLPTYLELPAGTAVTVIDAGDGLSGAPANLALAADASTSNPDLAPTVVKVNDGVVRTGGYKAGSDQVFTTVGTPDWVELAWDEPQMVGKVVWRHLSPWANYPAGGASAMIEGTLEYWNGSGWLPCPTVAGNHWDDRGRYSNPTADSFLAKVGDGPRRVTFWDRAWSHNLTFRHPVQTDRLRLKVTRSSAGSIPDYVSLAAAPFNLVASIGERLQLSQIYVFGGDELDPVVAPFSNA